MKPIDAALPLSALVIGVYSGYSMDRWLESSDRGAIQALEAKSQLLSDPEFAKLHHQIYSEVGEAQWESHVKPQFLSALTRAAARDAGELLPSIETVLRWARGHRAETRELLRQSAKAVKLEDSR